MIESSCKFHPELLTCWNIRTINMAGNTVKTKSYEPKPCPICGVNVVPGERHPINIDRLIADTVKVLQLDARPKQEEPEEWQLDGCTILREEGISKSSGRTYSRTMYNRTVSRFSGEYGIVELPRGKPMRVQLLDKATKTFQQVAWVK